MKRRSALLAFGLTGLLPLAGCQLLWTSLTSPFDWISGTGESIAGSFRALSVSSRSSYARSVDLAYRRDVRAFVAHFAASGGSEEDFLRGIGRVAASHGVTHWESEPATLEAIGEGLHDAGIDAAQMEALRRRSGDADPAVVARVLEGWSRAR